MFMANKHGFFNNISCLVFDIDGVLIKGENAIRGAPEAFNTIAKRIKVFALTNNSTRSRKHVAEKLKSLGFEISSEQVITSAFLAAEYCRKKKHKKYFYIGEEGIRTELDSAGLTLDPDNPSCVVVGLDRHITYSKLATATKAILNGAEFVATNTDKLLPLEKGFSPGGGAIVASVSCATGKKPVVVGKPKTLGLKIIAELLSLKKNQLAVVGDRYYTDIKMAKSFGCKSILVLTGIKNEPDPGKGKYQADMVIKNLKEIARVFSNIPKK